MGVFSESVTYLSAADLMAECFNRLESESNVKIGRVDIGDFYNLLNVFPDGKNEQLAELDNSFTSCIGGTFRSPRMGRFLSQKGVILSDDKCKGGFSISDLHKLVDTATVDEEGNLTPVGFKRPLKNVFVGIDTKEEGCLDNSMICFVLSLIKKQSQSRFRICLNVTIVDGDENESSELYREYRAYDPELDTPAPPAFPDY